MKKLSTTILHKGKEKAISVWLDDETARLLEECGDERLKHEYIIEEYKARLIERRETRRHQSLEKSMDSGFDMADENADIETEVFRTMDLDKLYQAVQQLEPQQKWLASFDTPEMKSLLSRKLERRQEWKNTGKGVAGLSQMEDHELLEKAFSAKNGDTVKRL